MASTDPTLAHRYGPSPPLPPSRLFACHSESDLQLRGLHFNHLDNGAGAGSGARSNGASPVTGSRLRTMEAGLDRDMTSSNNGSVSNTNHHYQHQRAELPPSPLHHHNHPHPLQQHIPGVGGGGGGVDSLGAGTPKPIRRRMRMITSCLECRRRKLKCNKSNPCTNCLKFSRDCLYLGPKLDEASQLRLTEIKEKVGSLERQLERDVAKSGGSTGSGAGPYHHQQQQQQRILADDVEGEFDEERDLEITPMVALDLTYEDDADGADDIMDLGVQVGKMRLTEKIGGLNRPRISEEVSLLVLTLLLKLFTSSSDLVAYNRFKQACRIPHPRYPRLCLARPTTSLDSRLSLLHRFYSLIRLPPISLFPISSAQARPTSHPPVASSSARSSSLRHY